MKTFQLSLPGFREGQEVYGPYPNALLCMRYISEVGQMILETDPHGTNSTTEDVTNLTEATSHHEESHSSSPVRNFLIYQIGLSLKK